MDAPFSLFGAFSGFDSLEECFDDMSSHIHALETGLSSDPSMNWRVSALDSYVLVSNSDAHSPSKLGREANIISTDMSYPAVAKALNGQGGLTGTIEFFQRRENTIMMGTVPAAYACLHWKRRRLRADAQYAGKG